MRHSVVRYNLPVFSTATRRHVVILASCVAIAFGAGLSLSRRQHDAPPAHPQIPGLLWPNPKALGPFSLVDQHGAEFNLERLRGKWSFLFFGYTNCPDICPTTMNLLSRVKRQLAERLHGQATQFIMVSVDPERDTPERLGTYVEYFDPDFLGLSGSREGLRDLTRQLGILHVRVEQDGSDDYLIDHSASILLLSPNVNLVGIFSAPHEAGDLAERATRIIDYVSAHS